MFRQPKLNLEGKQKHTLGSKLLLLCPAHHRLQIDLFLVFIIYRCVFVFIVNCNERPVSGAWNKRFPHLHALVAANLIYDSLVASVGPGDAAWCEQSADSARSMNKTFVEINPEMGPDEMVTDSENREFWDRTRERVCSCHVCVVLYV